MLADWLETFLRELDRDPSRASLPRFVERELRAYLDCEILARGFARVHGTGCGRDGLVALPPQSCRACFTSLRLPRQRPVFDRFSCKRRGSCPSCGARRMVDRAAHWIDRVLPDVPARQRVLSLPFELRYRLG